MSHNLIIDGIEYTPVEKISIPTADGSKAEFIVPSEIIDVSKNTDAPMDISNGKWLNVNVSDTQHFAYGYKTMTANTTFEIKGITDQQGKHSLQKGMLSLFCLHQARLIRVAVQHHHLLPAFMILLQVE